MEDATAADRAAVTEMINRPLRSQVRVAARCHLGLPAVVETPPVLDDGTPFPTLYWLCCPVASKRIYTVEASGVLRELDERFDHTEADAAYAARRNELLTAQKAAGHEITWEPRGGVGGAHGGTKCLHARYAFWRAGGPDAAGEWTAAQIGEPDCTEACVPFPAAAPTPEPAPEQAATTREDVP